MLNRCAKTIKATLITGIALLAGILLPENPVVSVAGKAYAMRAGEFEVKAAYLYHFTQFIHWPESAFDNSDSTFNICLMGGNPFGTALSPIFQRSYKGHSFSLMFPSESPAINECHILYLNMLSDEREAEILAQVATQPVLVISSSPGFIEQGGDIGFLSINDSVRFAINRDAGVKRGLVSSAKLLELAVQVIDTRTREKRP